MVQLYKSGKPRKDMIREYQLTPSALDKWIAQSQTSGSFKEKDNLTPEQLELNKLRKENKQLLMENDIQILDISNVQSPTIAKKYVLEAIEKQSENELTSIILDIFHASR